MFNSDATRLLSQRGAAQVRLNPWTDPTDHDSSSGMGSQMSGNALRMEYSMRSRISPGGMSHSETRRTSSKQVRRKGTRPVTLSGTLSDSA